MGEVEVHGTAARLREFVRPACYRQRGGEVVDFTNRSDGIFERLRQKEIVFPGAVLAELYLEGAKLGADRKSMVLSSVGNKHELVPLQKALLVNVPCVPVIDGKVQRFQTYE